MTSKLGTIILALCLIATPALADSGTLCLRPYPSGTISYTLCRPVEASDISDDEWAQWAALCDGFCVGRVTDGGKWSVCMSYSVPECKSIMDAARPALERRAAIQDRLESEQRKHERERIEDFAHLLSHQSDK